MLFAALAIATSLAVTADPLVIHVSPLGRAEWSGLAPEPTSDGLDGPLPDVASAIAAARGRQESGRQAIVEIGPGRYRLDAPIVLTPDDSGSPEFPFVIRAGEGASVVLDGGTAITDWTDADGRWTAPITGAIARVDSAWVAGERRPRARHPDIGEFEFIDPAPGGFEFSPGQLTPAMTGADLIARDGSRHTRLTLTRVDEARARAEASGDWTFDASQRVVVIGPGTLDAPGEWLAEDDRLITIPRDGERPNGFELVLPRLGSLITIQGEPGSPVHDVTLQNLGLEHWGMGAAVEARHAENLRIDGCRAAHGSGAGVVFAEGAIACAWTGGSIIDTGLEAAHIGSDQAPLPAGCTIEDASIRGAGCDDTECPAVRVLGANGAVVRRNDIAEAPAVGILVQAPPADADPDVAMAPIEISRNRVHHIDGGASPIGIDAAAGSRVDHNMVWEVGSDSSEGVGIWARSGAADSTIEHNIVTRCGGASVAIDAGASAAVENNLLAYSHAEQLRLVGEAPSPQLRVQRNVVVFNNGVLLGPGRSAWVDGGRGPAIMDWNLYADISRRDLWFACPNLAGWRALDRDANCLVAAPMLLDPTASDLRLDHDSPAFLLGFAPIDPDAIGPASTPALDAIADRVGMPSMIATPRVLDFENDQPRTRPDRMLINESPALGASVRIADGGIGGRACLRFRDAPGLTPNWLPSAGVNPRLPPGDYRVEFDLRVANAPDSVSGYILEHQWRDAWPGEYRAGPSLAVDSRGWMWSQGRKIVVLRPDHWWHVAIECQVGEQATGRYTIIVTGEDSVTRKFLLEGKVICALEWVGFVSPASASTVYEIDNLTITLREGALGGR